MSDELPPLKYNDRVLFVGKTQSGKTYAAGLLLSGFERLIVLDPKGLLGDAYRKRAGLYSWNLTDIDSPDGPAVARSLRDGGPGRLRIPVPTHVDDEEAYFDAWLGFAYRIQHVTVYIDEVMGVTSGTRPPRWLRLLYSRGAERNTGVWAATQLPTGIPRVIKTESDWYFLFRLTDPDDQDTMARKFGAIARRKLDKRQFFLYHDTMDGPLYYPYITAKE